MPTHSAASTRDRALDALRSRHAAPESGLLHTAGPGRTDNIRIKPASGSYVIPADVVSGLGEGSTMNGAAVLDKALAEYKPKMSPALKPIPQPSAPKTYRHGGRSDGVDIIAAGGEYVVSPEQCAAIGGGNVDKGHKILDEFVKQVRAKTIKTLRKLPGPVR